MLEFNLKKKQARKELYYKKNNFVADLGIELINKKTDLILHKPNSSILSDERLKLKNSSGNEFIINDIDLIFEKEKKVDALICNFDLQILLVNNAKNFYKNLYEILNKNGFFCFNLLTLNSFRTLQKIFLEIDDLIESMINKEGSGASVLFICTQCNYSSKHKTNLKEHVESKHIQSQGFTCNLCAKFCPNRKSLRNHIYSKHKSYDKFLL